MPYLNWKSASIKQEVSPQPSSPNGSSGSVAGEKMRMVLTIAASQIQEDLIPKLNEVFLEDGGELRVDLPEEWAIFWKKREGDSRLLIAHPEKDQWVATIALTADFAAKAVPQVSALTAGNSINFMKTGSVGAVSNLELIITAV